MKEQFRQKLHLSKNNIGRLDTINEIIQEYSQQGYILTLRQLYYQLVTRDVIPNEQKEYAKLSSILVKGRMTGIVDWDAIEDRIRTPYIPYFIDNIKEALEDTIHQYRLDRQKNQNNYIELWVEKDALSGVLKRVTREYHIRLMVNRGYSSCTAMHDAYERILPYELKGITSHILYLGDHDPSGLDMIRDIDHRLNEFGISPIIQHIGITKEQILRFKPPVNPAKITDPRAKWYIKEHGEYSWEVDALNPEILNQLVKNNIEILINVESYNNIIKQETKDKKTIEKMIN